MSDEIVTIAEWRVRALARATIEGARLLRRAEELLSERRRLGQATDDELAWIAEREEE